MSPFIRMLVNQEDEEFLGLEVNLNGRTFFFTPIVDHSDYWVFQEIVNGTLGGEESESFPDLESALCAAYLQTKSEGPY